MIFGCSWVAALFIGGTSNALAKSSKIKSGNEIRQINQLLARIKSVEDTDTRTAFALINIAKKLSAL